MKKLISIDSSRLLCERYKLGLSRKSLADQCGVSSQTIANIESGKACTKPEILKRLCDALNIQVEDVISVN